MKVQIIPLQFFLVLRWYCSFPIDKMHYLRSKELVMLLIHDQIAMPPLLSLLQEELPHSHFLFSSLEEWCSSFQGKKRSFNRLLEAYLYGASSLWFRSHLELEILSFWILSPPHPLDPLPFLSSHAFKYWLIPHGREEEELCYIPKLCQNHSWFFRGKAKLEENGSIGWDS